MRLKDCDRSTRVTLTTTTLALIALQLCGCVSVAKVGRSVTIGGGVVAGLGVLDVVGVFGGGRCHGDGG